MYDAGFVGVSTSQWLFADGITTQDHIRCKDGLYDAVVSVVRSEEFLVDPAASSDAILANHSTKKYATTHHRRRGVSKDKDFMDGPSALEDTEKDPRYVC